MASSIHSQPQPSSHRRRLDKPPITQKVADQQSLFPTSHLGIDAPGHVPWWPRPDVKLFNIMVHVLTETNRHAGHADILRERLDGAVGFDAESTTRHGRDAAFWENHRAQIEQAARAADPHQA